MKEVSVFSVRLAELMREQGLNNYTLSLKLGCQDQSIANWLQGAYYPRYDMLFKLADYFDCSVDYLLGLSDDYSYILCKQEATFFERYLMCLKQNNTTSYKVVKDCRISKPASTYWLKYRKMPETAALITLAKYFDCSVDFLLGRTAV